MPDLTTDFGVFEQDGKYYVWIKLYANRNKMIKYNIPYDTKLAATQVANKLQDAWIEYHISVRKEFIKNHCSRVNPDIVLQKHNLSDLLNLLTNK